MSRDGRRWSISVEADRDKVIGNEDMAIRASSAARVSATHFSGSFTTRA
jgi:hypothetical protein